MSTDRFPIDEDDRELDRELDLYDEEKLLKTALKVRDYQRYGKFFYVKRNGLRKECSLREFAWCYGKQPKYANEMSEWVKENVVDCADIIKMFGRGNRMFEKKEILDEWDEAISKVYANKKSPDFEYTYDVLNFDKPTLSYNITSEDGDLFNGILIEKAFSKEIEIFSIKFEYSSKDEDEEDKDDEMYSVEYEFEITDINEFSNEYELEDYIMFCPFKHPVPLINLHGSLEISCRLKENSEVEVDAYSIAPVISVVNYIYKQWLENNVLKFTLFDNDQYIYDGGYVDECDTNEE